jgi:predicted amidohydrolase
MKLAAVSFPLTKPHDYKAWLSEADRWLLEAQQQKVDLIVFPEYMSLALETDADFKEWYRSGFQIFFSTWAKKSGMTILAGTHNVGHNQAPLFFPDGQVVQQNKIHLIPSEPDIAAGAELQLSSFAHGKIATTICYDVEFPELTRAAVKDGVNLLLCPSWTEKTDGFHRVRYCAHARAVENQLFVVHAPLVGSLAPWGVEEHAVGSAAIIAPSDPLFPANGLLAEGNWNEGALVTAVVDFEQLSKVRQSGAVRTYRDFMSQKSFTVSSAR